jgi:ribosomal protein S18 acetylase RimI-like enzyme
MNEITIKPARSDELPVAALLTAKAMNDLPEVMAVFQGKRERVQTAWQFAFTQMPGQVFLAKDGEEILGVMRVVEWPDCKPSPVASLRFLPAMLVSLRGSVLRGMKHQSTWAKHDPQEHHWHLDPLAVTPERQGQGIGTQLMNHFCEFVDSRQAAGYLETGTTSNVRFYEKFGFSVAEEVPVNNVNTWLMWRSGQADAPER